MANILEIDDIDLLLECIDTFDKLKSSKVFGSIVNHQIAMFAVSKDKTEDEVARQIDRAVSEVENEVAEIHERCVLLQAKLYNVRKNILLTQASGGLFGKEIENQKTDSGEHSGGGTQAAKSSAKEAPDGTAVGS